MMASRGTDMEAQEIKPVPIRWVVLAVATVVLLMSVIVRIAWSNIAPKAGADLGLTPVNSLTAFATTSHLGFLVAAIFGGLVTDWLGPRRVLIFLVLGLGLATAAFGFVNNVGQGMVLQFCMGLLAGPCFAIGVKLVSSWFPRIGRATAMGVFMVGTSLAVVVVNLIVPWLMTYISWREVYLAIGLLTAALALPAFLFVRNDSGTTDQAKSVRSPSPFASVMPLLRNRNFRWLALANWGGPWGTWGFAIWASTLLVEGRGISTVEAGVIVASFGAGAVIAKLATGILSDLLGGRRKELTCLILAVYGISLVLFPFIEDINYIAMVAPVLGIFAFGYSPLLNTMIAETAGKNAGSAAGLSLVLTTAGDSFQPILLGILFTTTGSLPVVFFTLAIGPFIAALCVIKVREGGTTHDSKVAGI